MKIQLLPKLSGPNAGHSGFKNKLELYMNRISEISIILILFPILLFAQWPTELLTGLPLSNDSERNDIVKAICSDGEDGYYFCVESSGRLYINHVDINGNVRWPIERPANECYADQNTGWPYNGPKREDVIMACNTDGEVWVTWMDFRSSYTDDQGWPTSADVYIQKFDQDRIAQWSPQTALLVQAHVDPSDDPGVADWRGAYHLEPQDDGSVIIIWADRDQSTVSYQGNQWAQKFDPEGNPLWDTPGIRLIPDSEWGGSGNFASEYYHSDGIGGVLFMHLNKPLRLLPSGELAWEYGSIVVDRIDGPRDMCEGYDNTMVILADGRNENNEEDYSFVTVVDTSGNNVHGPTSVGNPEYEFAATDIGKINNREYGIDCFDNQSVRYYKINESIEQISEIVPTDSFPYYYPDSYKFSPFGKRLVTKYQSSPYYDPSHHEILGWDRDGNHLFTYGLDEDPYNVGYILYDVDESGNTWVFWHANIPGYTVYANVINANGGWGHPFNSINNPSGSVIIPPEISLHVYPNPGNGQFNIYFDLVDPSPVTFILTNVLGQRIYSFELPRNAVASGLLSAGFGESGLLTLDLKDQASGTYFLQVRTESGQVQQKRILLMK